MNLDEAIAEARAIDGRALGGLIPPPDDALRAIDLVEYFDAACEAETTEEAKMQRALEIVKALG